MKKARIARIEYSLASIKVTNQKLVEEFPEWQAEKISAKTGIFERTICSEDEYASDLAIKAAEKLFGYDNSIRNSVDFLLYCTQSPDYFLPTTACILQENLNLSKTIGALDFNLGCSGFVYGLSLAKGLIQSEAATNVLLITAETYSKFIHQKDKSNRSIFGDGASATLITSNAKNENKGIGNFSFSTEGTGYCNLIVKNGGIRNRNYTGRDIIENGNFIRNDDHLYMNGQEIFQYTTSKIPILVNDCLKRNLLSLKEVDLFIFHQANKYMLNHIRRKIGIPEDKFFVFLNKVGNTVSSTIPIAISEAQNTNRIKPGMKIMIVGFGVGYSAGATIIDF